MGPVHSLEAPATRLPAYAHQHAAAGWGATEKTVAPLLGKFVCIL